MNQAEEAETAFLRHERDEATHRIAHVEQALREAEARVCAEQQSLQVYLRIWLRRHGTHWFWRRKPRLRITQNELLEAAREVAAGSRLTFEVEQDGETLRVGEAQ